jgi:hypothetical protein
VRQDDLGDNFDVASLSEIRLRGMTDSLRSILASRRLTGTRRISPERRARANELEAARRIDRPARA